MSLVIRRAISQLRTISHLKLCRNFHDDFSSSIPKEKPKPKNHLVSGAIATKFQIFEDCDATVILDVEEERMKYSEGEVEQTKKQQQYAGINLEHGLTGVIDVEELVDILRKDNGQDIFVCSVPKEFKYVDYICVVSGISFRHMRAMAEFVRKAYKMKKRSGDVIPKIEGEGSKDWMALDLGNIALHIFSRSARKQYDLESLWTVGSEYDKEYNKPQDTLIELYERHSIYLSDLKPRGTQEKDVENASN